MMTCKKSEALKNVLLRVAQVKLLNGSAGLKNFVKDSSGINNDLLNGMQV